MESNLHRKALGALGEARVIEHLIGRGYQVFTEFGDNSKIDLVAVDKDYNLTKVQVKCYHSKDETVSVYTTKSGPNYQFRYEHKHADVYAIYVYDKKILLFISADEVLGNKRSITIRLKAPENNQTKGIKMFNNYTSFEDAL